MLVICKPKVHWVALLLPDALCQSAAALFGAVVCHVTTATGGFLVNHRISYIVFFVFSIVSGAACNRCYRLFFYLRLLSDYYQNQAKS